LGTKYQQLASLAPDEKKVDAVKHAQAPQSISELRSFLGLANYCARYISHFATIVEPLRHLTRAGVKWSWTAAHQQAFDKVKSMLTSDCVMSHFDPSVETQLKVDASPFGLGAVLLQGSEGDERPVAYASRTLTDVERRYSQTEKEALAVVGM
jgi:bacterioferritin-associated ferredoxin